MGWAGNMTGVQSGESTTAKIPNRLLVRTSLTWSGSIKVSRLNKNWMWRSIQHNNTTLLSRFLFLCTSLLGQWGQIRFSEFLEIISSFFAQNFCTDRVDILLCSKRKKMGGGVSSKFGTLAPWKYCGRRRQARVRLRPRRVCVSDRIDKHALGSIFF